MAILAELDAKRELAAEALLEAKLAITDRARQAAEEHDMELAEAIADWETVLTAASEILMHAGDDKVRAELLAKALTIDEEMERKIDQE
jgi:hypothetical protein